MLLLAIVAWFLIVAPLQYFLHIVTGAPARTMLDAGLRTLFIPNATDGIDIVMDVPIAQPIPEGAVEAGFIAKPVTLTMTINSVALWAVSWFVERFGG